MPEENSFVRFHSGQYQFKVPFIIYTDFEVIHQSSEGETELDPEAPYTREINHNISSRLCTCPTFAYAKVKVENPLKLYQGKDCMEVFCDHIEEEAKMLYHMFPEMPVKCFTHKEWREFNGVTKCHICFGEFEEDDRFNYNVRDYYHHMGLCQGPAHRIWNLWYVIPHYNLVIFHNLSG